MTNTTTTVTCDLCGRVIATDGQVVDAIADSFIIRRRNWFMQREWQADLCGDCIAVIRNAAKKGEAKG